MKIFSVKSKTVTILITVFLFASLLFSCSDTVKFKYTNGVFVDSSKDSEYVECSPAIIAAAIGEKKAHFGNTYFHLIPGYENGEFLTQKFEDGYSVIRKKDQYEPVLSDLEITKISICRITEKKAFAEAETEDRELIEKIIKAVSEVSDSEDADVLLPANPVFTRELRISSENYPYLYYRISYIEDTRGQGYLYDRSTGIFNCVGDLLIGKLL